MSENRDLRLPNPDAPPNERYIMPNPDALFEAYDDAREAVWNCKKEPSMDDIKALLSLAQGYLRLTTYELGQENCVGTLRDIWRERRRIAKGDRAARANS